MGNEYLTPEEFPPREDLEWIKVEAPDYIQTELVNHLSCTVEFGKKQPNELVRAQGVSQRLYEKAKEIFENSKDFKVTWGLKKPTDPHAHLKKQKEELEALGYVVKIFWGARAYDEVKEVCSFDKLKGHYTLKVYKLDWDKVLAWSYANGEFVIVEVCDRNGRWHTTDVAGHLYRLCGYSIHNNGKDKKFHTYSLSCFPFDDCPPSRRNNPKRRMANGTHSQRDRGDSVMNEHNYTALTTFRGWSEETKEWFYGSLVILTFNGVKEYYIYDEKGERKKAHPDSIGIYTGKDDKDGTPIFCGVAGAEFGGDNVYAGSVRKEFYVKWNEDTLTFYIYYFAGVQCTLGSEAYVEVISTQWEEHLKANQ